MAGYNILTKEKWGRGRREIENLFFISPQYPFPPFP
jgi:hypothetical protein